VETLAEEAHSSRLEDIGRAAAYQKFASLLLSSWLGQLPEKRGRKQISICGGHDINK